MQVLEEGNKRLYLCWTVNPKGDGKLKNAIEGFIDKL